MNFLRDIADALLPSARNSYRPYFLSKHSLALFLAGALVAEAYFVSGMFNLNPSQPLLAAAVEVAPATDLAQVVLIALAVVLGLLLIAAVAVHAHVQPTDVLLPGGVILGIVVLLLALNAWYGGAYG